MCLEAFHSGINIRGFFKIIILMLFLLQFVNFIPQ